MFRTKHNAKKLNNIVRMKYIKQLDSFREISITRHLKPAAVVLYDVLLLINKKKGFSEWFAATNDYLQTSANISSWKAFSAARQALIDNGFICYIPGQTGLPSQYSLTKLYDPVPEPFKHDLELSYQAYSRMEGIILSSVY